MIGNRVINLLQLGQVPNYPSLNHKKERDGAFHHVSGNRYK